MIGERGDRVSMVVVYDPGVMDGQVLNTLFHHGELRVSDFRCAGQSTCRGGEEIAGTNEMVITRRGAFAVRCGGRPLFVDSTCALFLGQGARYRVDHPVSGGDSCTVLGIGGRTLEDARRHGAPAWPAGGKGADVATSRSLVADAFLEHWRWLRRLQGGNPDALHVTESLLQFLGTLLERTGRAPRSRGVGRRPSTTLHHRRLTDSVRELIHQNHGRRLSLGEIARAAHTSPYHLCHVFKQQTGDSIHAFLNRVRLQSAIERLAHGERDLTRLALDLGYSSRGHFSDAFRREFRVAPSSVRRDLS